MNETEFRKRVYADPHSDDPKIAEAAAADGELAAILDEARSFDAELSEFTASVSVPDTLRAKLMAIPANADADSTDGAEALGELAARPAANSSYFQYFAFAASLLLAVGVTLSFTLNRGPSQADLALAQAVLGHLLSEQNELNAIRAGGLTATVALPEANQAMASTGYRLTSADMPANAALRMAKPCIIYPSNRSAHLMVERNGAAVNVIVIDSSPVSREYQLNDNDFDTRVIPMEDGNLILVGDHGADLEGFQNLFEASGPLI